MSQIQNLSRRVFLRNVVSGAGLILGAYLAPSFARAESNADLLVGRTTFHPNIFLGLESDGTVFIVAHRSEMGNGSRTDLPRVVADELDADWNRVRIIQAIGDPRYGSQATDASSSVRGFFDLMRQVGATARQMLLSAAAAKWSVPASECVTDLHVVVHQPTHRRLTYGELATAASNLPVPRREDVILKARTAWRYIGKDASLYDLHDICTGKAIYGMDARIEGIIYASIERPPVLGGSVVSCEDHETLRVPGVRETVRIEPFTAPHGAQPLGGIAVLADSTWAAFQGREKLRVTWDHGSNSSYNTDKFKKELQESVRQPGKVRRNEGDVEAEFAKRAEVFEADYFTPHLAHASMEPPVAVADYRDGKVTVWAPTQDPQGIQQIVARLVGIKPEEVTCHVTLLGGGFGRKTFPDFAAEAAVLSKKVGRPVKVVWSREDDIKFGFYLPCAAVYLKAALDDRGKPTAWLGRSAFPPINSTFDVSARYGSWELNNSWIEVPFDIQNIRIETRPAPAHVRLGWLRGVASNFHTFAVQSFIDELAHRAGQDPVDYRLQVFGPPRISRLSIPEFSTDPRYPLDIGRLRVVTEMAADKAGWGKQKFVKGQGQGIAVHRYASTYVASVVQVEVATNGEIRIPRVDTAVDIGTAVNPDNIRRQFEGSAVFGTSIGRSGEITLTNGVVNQSNFFDYPVARINEAPYQTNVHLVESLASPGGAGEPGVGVIAPALANAIFAAIGKRIRELPLDNKVGSPAKS